MNAQVRRFLGVFTAYDRPFHHEIDVTHIPLAVLKDIFQPPPDDPLMYDCYNVNSSQATKLQEYIPEPIDMNRYKYQLQAESAE